MLAHVGPDPLGLDYQNQWLFRPALQRIGREIGLVEHHMLGVLRGVQVDADSVILSELVRVLPQPGLDIVDVLHGQEIVPANQPRTECTLKDQVNYAYKL